MIFITALGIFTPIYKLFGWLMKMLYIWLNNYGLVIIVFNLIVKGCFLPVNLDLQRNMARQMFLRDDIAKIKRHYASDPRKASEAQMLLMQLSDVSMTAGCFPQLIQFLILICIWRPIQAPLQYIAGVSPENLGKIAELLVDRGVLGEAALRTYTRTDVGILAGLKQAPSVLAKAIDNGWIRLSQILDLNFLGMDLGVVPSFRPKQIFGASRATYLPLFILILVMLGTMFISMHLAKRNQHGPRQSKEEKKRAQKNPAKAKQAAAPQSSATLTGMSWFNVIIMLWMAFSVPSAMALYWTSSNVVALIQIALAYEYYIKPAQAMLEERKAMKQIPRKRKA